MIKLTPEGVKGVVLCGGEGVLMIMGYFAICGQSE